MIKDALDSEEAKAHLKMISKSHSRGGYGIKPELYDQWLDCLIASAKEHDEYFEPSIGLAWRKSLQPSIDIMQSRY